jgi:phospholipid/cholesterol/gamma-HCH transport system substrate-binding protein
MEESGYRFGVGVVVLASAIIGILLISFFGSVPTFMLDRYRVTITFPSAPGVGPDTPVRKNGVDIGRVAGIKLLDGSAGVNLELELDRNVKITQGETCKISAGSLITGDATVEFVKASEREILARFDGLAGGLRNDFLDAEEKQASDTPMAAGDLLGGGVVQTDPLEILMNMQGNFSQTFAAIDRASQKVESLATSLEEVVGGGQGQLRDVIDRVKGTVETFNGTLGTINRVAIQIEDSRLPEAIAEALERLPSIFDEAKTVIQQTQRILVHFEKLSGTLESLGGEFTGIGGTAKEAVDNASIALRNIGRFTDPLGERADELIDGAVNSLQNLDVLLADMRVFANRLNSGNGTIARLVDDQQLYFEVIQTIQNVRLLSQRLQPIADDVRVFTDKIARDPGQLGVRGALQGRPIGAGLK